MVKKMREERKQLWIAEQIEKKNAERKRKFLESGVPSQLIDCCSCYHHATENCPTLDPIDSVCPYWYSPDAPVIGIAYCVEGIGAEKARKKAKK